MSTPNLDRLREELGEVNYDLWIKGRADMFNADLKLDKNERTVQTIVTSIATSISALIAYNFARNNLEWEEALTIQAAVIGIAYAAHRALHNDRKYYYEHMQKTTNDIRESIPENLRLFTDSIMVELEIGDDRMPIDPEIQRRQRLIRGSVRSTLEKLIPYLIGLLT